MWVDLFEYHVSSSFDDKNEFNNNEFFGGEHFDDRTNILMNVPKILFILKRIFPLVK